MTLFSKFQVMKIDMSFFLNRNPFDACRCDTQRSWIINIAISPKRGGQNFKALSVFRFSPRKFTHHRHPSSDFDSSRDELQTPEERKKIKQEYFNFCKRELFFPS